MGYGRELIVFGEMQPIHWLIVIAVAMVLFGARRLPVAARGVGRAARILKAELGGLHEDQRQSTGNGTVEGATSSAPGAAPGGSPVGSAPGAHGEREDR
jgi:sec-independent protein translocase protein TatA